MNVWCVTEWKCMFRSFVPTISRFNALDMTGCWRSWIDEQNADPARMLSMLRALLFELKVYSDPCSTSPTLREFWIQKKHRCVTSDRVISVMKTTLLKPRTPKNPWNMWTFLGLKWSLMGQLCHWSVHFNKVHVPSIHVNPRWLPGRCWRFFSSKWSFNCFFGAAKTIIFGRRRLILDPARFVGSKPGHWCRRNFLLDHTASVQIAAKGSS